MKNTKNRERLTKSRVGDIIFYCILLAWPLLQFGVFYVGTSLTSLVIGFRENGNGAFSLTNFLDGYKNLVVDPAWRDALFHSVQAYLITVVISVPLGLLFSYYIYKKLFGSKLFRIILFLPSIISALVLASIFIAFAGKAGFGNLFKDTKSSFWLIMAFNIWMSFGTNVLMYSNAMGNISPEVIEAAKLDGCSPFREFFHVILPAIYPTITVFLVVGFAGVFINQFNLPNFFGLDGGARWETIGYRLYYLALGAKNSGSLALRAKYAAYGVSLTLIAVPFTYLIKYLLERFGPSEK
ncbi:MAG: sugar ABC transporter permease [Bacilli bacterium]|nr:sugar ABC transporter permease [Bacilli bacterium]